MSGRASAEFVPEGPRVYFGGTLAITRGTGSYARASGTGLGISGIINRETFKLIVHLNGKMRL
jgi:hypothetical protein